MAALIEYKCPCCGGTVEFDSSIQQMKCPYCETIFDLDELRDKDTELHDSAVAAMSEQQIDSAFEKEEKWTDDGMNVYICKSCKGEIIVPETTAATKCPYCGNPIMMTGKLAGDLMPDIVVPFKLGKEQAMAALRQHMSGKKLLPKLFTSDSTLEEIQGVYVPYWVVDADAEGYATYDATNTRAWSDSRYDYVETSYYKLTRQGTMGFRDIPCDASQRMDDDMMESIEPFDLSAAVDFQTAYLSGYLADRYDVSKDDSVAKARKRLTSTVKRALNNSVAGFGSTSITDMQIGTTRIKARYALLPVWTMNVSWNGNLYKFAMNGQTGKIVGNMPVDNSLATKLRLLYGAGIGAVIFAILSAVSGMI